MVKFSPEAAGRAAPTCVQRRLPCSLTDLQRVAQVMRDYWSIEIQQYWVLDVQFCKGCKNHPATNLGVI